MPHPQTPPDQAYSINRQTKIIATLGPSTDQAGVLQGIIPLINAVRLNFSHGSIADHASRAEAVRQLCQEYPQHSVAIIADLQGPKIRIANFKNHKVHLQVGQKFCLSSKIASEDGDEQGVGLDYPLLLKDLRPGKILVLDDGKIELLVEKVEPENAECRVLVGGKLSNRKGINLIGGGLSAPALSSKDKEHIVEAIKLNCDFLCVSFPSSGKDMIEARQIADANGGKELQLIAKFERAEAVYSQKNMDEIIQNSDGVMVARGDLGVEIGDPKLIGIQKKLIRRAKQLGKFVVTATQMMESMRANPVPTRAEVFDIANAVVDGTDVVMLSAETASGDYPIEAVRKMNDIIQGAEASGLIKFETAASSMAKTSEQAIAISATYMSMSLENVVAIISYTVSGHTPKLISRAPQQHPIIAISSYERTLRRVALYRGVFPIFIEEKVQRLSHINSILAKKILEQFNFSLNERVIITRGVKMGLTLGTNQLNVFRIKEILHSHQENDSQA